MTEPVPTLYILAEGFGRALAFANDHQLMPGWVYVNTRRDEVFRGTVGPTVLCLPGWRAYWGHVAAAGVDMLLQNRSAVMLDPDSDLDRWRRPDARRVVPVPVLQSVPPRAWVRLRALPGMRVRHDLGHDSWVRVDGEQVTVGHAGMWWLEYGQIPLERQDGDG